MTKTGLGKVLGLATMLSMMGSGLSGCDYWPPALQAEIEQLRTELQTITAEKSRLERQLSIEEIENEVAPWQQVLQGATGRQGKPWILPSM